LRISNSRLGDVADANDFAAEFVNLFFFVPTGVLVELHAQRRGQHRRRHFLGKIARGGIVHAISVQFAQITVGILFGGLGHADGSGNETVGFIGRATGHDRKGDLAGLQELFPLFAGDDPTSRRQDAGNVNQVAHLDAGIAQRQLETAQLVLVRAHALGQKNPRRYKVHTCFVKKQIPQPNASRKRRKTFDGTPTHPLLSARRVQSWQNCSCYPMPPETSRSKLLSPWSSSVAAPRPRSRSKTPMSPSFTPSSSKPRTAIVSLTSTPPMAPTSTISASPPARSATRTLSASAL